MFWITCLLKVPNVVNVREDRDVRDYVTRSLFLPKPERPTIDITDKARDHILSRGGRIYLMDTRPVSFCCGGVAFGPLVQIGTPSDPEAYIREEINRVVVFVPKVLSVPFKLTIELKQRFGMRSLQLLGWRVF